MTCGSCLLCTKAPPSPLELPAALSEPQTIRHRRPSHLQDDAAAEPPPTHKLRRMAAPPDDASISISNANDCTTSRNYSSAASNGAGNGARGAAPQPIGRPRPDSPVTCVPPRDTSAAGMGLWQGGHRDSGSSPRPASSLAASTMQHPNAMAYGPESDLGAQAVGWRPSPELSPFAPMYYRMASPGPPPASYSLAETRGMMQQAPHPYFPYAMNLPPPLQAMLHHHMQFPFPYSVPGLPNWPFVATPLSFGDGQLGHNAAANISRMAAIGQLNTGYPAGLQQVAAGGMPAALGVPEYARYAMGPQAGGPAASTATPISFMPYSPAPRLTHGQMPMPPPPLMPPPLMQPNHLLHSMPAYHAASNAGPNQADVASCDSPPEPDGDPPRDSLPAGCTAPQYPLVGSSRGDWQRRGQCSHLRSKFNSTGNLKRRVHVMLFWKRKLGAGFPVVDAMLRDRVWRNLDSCEYGIK